MKRAVAESASPGGKRQDTGAIRDFLVARLAGLRQVAPSEVSHDVSFADQGLSLRDAACLLRELEAFLSRPISIDIVFEHPTVARLAQRLGESAKMSSPTGAAVRPLPTERGIAIIGIGCRVPGASGAAAFWELLRNGVDAITEVPADRWDAHARFDPTGRGSGKLASRYGGFITDVDLFDAAFFSITAREAVQMDPQQRILLQVAWEALEDAGVPATALAGTDTGVFVGISTGDYGHVEDVETTAGDPYAASGNARAVTANRISYFLDLHGPSLAIDTACSSSLTAVHFACESLRRGECGMALVGGVNLILNPALSVHLSKAGLLAVDGRCKTFDARADGYGRGEGAALVVLKPVERAIEDGDSIYAVIQGSAVNSNGRSNGLMAPNRHAQAAVIRAACRAAHVSPGDLDYVELHGTGTFLGDPIEAGALATVLAEGGRTSPCAVGSVKSNVGHLEAAAGIVGLIKVALSLRNRQIPPSLHFETPNPHIDFAKLRLRVQTTLEDWPEHAKVAGVSSFGFGGTNGHAILAPPPPAPGRTDTAPSDSGERELFPISAQSPAALGADAEHLA